MTEQEPVEIDEDTGEYHCPKCGKLTPDYSKYCGQCGERIFLPPVIEGIDKQENWEVLKCDHGLEKDSGYKFCPICQTNL